jgi:hypothetical protein
MHSTRGLAWGEVAHQERTVLPGGTEGDLLERGKPEGSPNQACTVSAGPL